MMRRYELDMIKTVLCVFALIICLLPGCSTPEKKPGTEIMNITYDRRAIEGCTLLGEVVGSAGHWYNFWFISNDVLTNAAYNDLLNKSQALGADTVYVPNHTLVFGTSVTILGQAYRCGK